MKVIIVEDEPLAVEQLEFLLNRYNPAIEILARLNSVKSAVEWFNKNELPDLVFFDIQLTDGTSFEILEKVKINCPIIFATAYEEYTLQAFKTNGIAYILKPYDQEEIWEAMGKYEQLKSNFAQSGMPNLVAIQQTLKTLQNRYKDRFLVKSGNQLVAVSTADISYFYHENKIVWLKTLGNKKYAIDYTLEQLESILNPGEFFRINRKYILAFSGIQKVQAYSSNRLKIVTQHPVEDEVVVSRDRVNRFKEWLDGSMG